jgi:hypothetical protein
MTMKRTLLVAATAIALSAPAVPHAHAAPDVNPRCQVAGQNVQNLVTQIKVHVYAKPNPADRSATSVWLHQGFALVMQEVLEVDQMILKCPRFPGYDLTAINAETTGRATEASAAHQRL